MLCEVVSMVTRLRRSRHVDGEWEGPDWGIGERNGNAELLENIYGFKCEECLVSMKIACMS